MRLKWRESTLGYQHTERTIFCGWKIKKIDGQVHTCSILTGDSNDKALNGSAVLQKCLERGRLRVIVDDWGNMLGVILFLSEGIESKDEEGEENADDGHFMLEVNFWMEMGI